MGAFRSDERVEHELPDLLRTAAGDHDLCGPLKGSLPCGHVDDGEASIQLHGLRVGAVVPFTSLRVGIYPRPAECLPACVPPRARGGWSTGLLIRLR